MFLEGDRLALRAPERADAPLFVKWLNDPEVYPFLMRDRPISLAEEEEYLAKGHERKDDVLFVMCLRDGGRPIGAASLHGVRSAARGANLGILIGEEGYRDRGYGREAMELLCRYGFESLNLNRIGLAVWEYNPRAVRCYERVGFRPEGRRREAKFWKGRYWDELLMGLLAREWRAGRPEEAPALCQMEES